MKRRIPFAAKLDYTRPMGRFFRDNARWLMAGFTLTLCSSFGQTFFISLFAGEIKAVYGLSDGDWGGIYTVATLASAAVLVQAGGLADTMGLRRLSLMVLGLYVAVALGMAVNGSVWVLVALIAGLRFCGQGMMSHIGITAMGRWFRAHRGRAVAVAGLGHSVGEAVLPSIAVALLLLIGWRATWGLVAVVMVLGFAPVIALLLDEGRRPKGEAELILSAGIGGRQWSRGDVLRHWLFWALLPGLLAPSFIGTSAFFHQVHVSEVKGWALAVMALGYPAYAGVTVVSALACGWLVDRIGPVRLLPVYLLPMGAAMAVLTLGANAGAWHAAMALMGMTQGIGATLYGALWPELFGTRHLGAVKALAAAVMVLATALGPGITGMLIDQGVMFPDQGWVLALWCAAASAVFLAVSARLRREMAA
ncbi:MAG TPA: MFS transporter [Thermohalobaculum sp.]|nr:MFS transporter [Thermohalobaculum sp.]